MFDKVTALINAQPTQNISCIIEHDDNYFEHNPQTTYYPASTIKVANAIVNLMKHHKEVYELLLPVKDTVPGCGVLYSMRSVDSISLYDTIVLSIIISDNTAANMLIDNIGVEALNDAFIELGLSDTYLRGLYYDFENTNPRHSTISARDLFHCIQLIEEENELLSNDIRHIMHDIMKRQQFNDRVGAPFLYDSDEDMFIATKTGSVDNVEHDFGTIYYEGNSIRFVVLSDGWPDNLTARVFMNDFGVILKSHIDSMV